MTVEQHPSSAQQQPVYREQHPSGPLPSRDPSAVLADVAADVRPMSGFAVSSLVWGLIGLFTFGVAAVGGAICGHIAVRETRYGAYRGHGLAVAGLIISWVQIGGWLVFGVITLFGILLRAANL